MTIIKKCCCYFSLRVGAQTVAYMGITSGVAHICWIILGKNEFCGKILYLWVTSSIWSIISAMLLLTAVYRDNPNLLPLHLVTCLIGLILEMVSHLLIASGGTEDYELIGYGFYAIGFMTADTLIVLSYYQTESLRVGAKTVAYMGITSALTHICWISLGKNEFCKRILYLWVTSSIWSIISAMLLLTAVYRNNPNLLPLHLVTCLIGLILEMVSHLLITSGGTKDFKLIGYAFYAIGFMTADTLIVLSYYLSVR